MGNSATRVPRRKGHKNKGHKGATKTTTNNNTTLDMTSNELRNKLMHIIDIEYGLLHTLRSKRVLNPSQIEVIKSKPTVSSQIGQLIDDVFAMSSEHQEHILTALNETQQSHVVEYIRANGIRTEAHGDNWPLVVSKCYDNIETNWANLIEMLDSKNGLLDELLSVGCISRQHKQRIEAGKTDADANELLLLILQRRSVSDYNKLIECLNTTKNYQAVMLLDPDNTKKIRFLSAEQKKKLVSKHALLIAIIDTKHGLLAELLSADCITWRQKQSIEEAATQVKRNTALLEIVARGSESDFEQFMNCLDKTGQPHVRGILMEDSVAFQMVAKISGNGNITEDEVRIVEHFTRLLDASSDESVEILSAKVNRLIDERLGRDVRLAALDTRGSIRLFYLCKSLTGVRYLNELYSSGELQIHIEELFTMLLDKGQPVSLASLAWNMADYTNGVRNLCASSDLPLFDEIYRMATESHHNTTQSDTVIVLGFELLPSEMVELLLLKAAGQLFDSFTKMTPRAEAFTLATLSAASYIWWRTLTYRQFNKQLLKSYFKQVCRPYKCSPRQLMSIIKSDDNVRGVAELNNILYVACYGSNKIQMFDSRPPFSQLEDIRVEGLDDPRDIVVCSETSQLYIIDWQRCVILRVNLLLNKQVDKLITTHWQPFSMSIKSRRLLLTPIDGDALYIYGDDGVQLNRIPLPYYMAGRHAVESSRNTYIVSHYKRCIGDTQSEYKDGVSEFDIDGRIIRQFNIKLDASLQFNEPHKLLIDASDHVIVADSDNERIVVLKPDLQLKRVLILKLQGQPTRMCLNEETGLLFVGFWSSTEIRIFSVLKRHDSD